MASEKYMKYFNILVEFVGQDKPQWEHPSVEKDLCLKIEVRDQTIWKSTHEL